MVPLVERVIWLGVRILALTGLYVALRLHL